MSERAFDPAGQFAGRGAEDLARVALQRAALGGQRAMLGEGQGMGFGELGDCVGGRHGAILSVQIGADPR
ncbi:MAG TPA: hypothetical protein VMT37_08685 [Solirubrobacterales bacterium]|nr:hypothetical protein [Solirubrobacterales bacterium]